MFNLRNIRIMKELLCVFVLFLTVLVYAPLASADSAVIYDSLGFENFSLGDVDAQVAGLSDNDATGDKTISLIKGTVDIIDFGDTHGKVLDLSAYLMNLCRVVLNGFAVDFRNMFRVFDHLTDSLPLLVSSIYFPNRVRRCAGQI